MTSRHHGRDCVHASSVIGVLVGYKTSHLLIVIPSYYDPLICIIQSFSVLCACICRNVCLLVRRSLVHACQGVHVSFVFKFLVPSTEVARERGKALPIEALDACVISAMHGVHCPPSMSSTLRRSTMEISLARGDFSLPFSFLLVGILS
jgi:hypothetical protein